MQQVRNLIRQINIMERQSYSLFLLKDKYEVQSRLISGRYKYYEQNYPDAEETKVLAMASKLLCKLSDELNAAYYQKEDSKPWKP